MSRALVWFRRDLRNYDHAALSQALTAHDEVYCAFVFDRDILDTLSDKCDRRVEFIWLSVKELGQSLSNIGGGLIVRQGSARSVIPALARELQVAAVYANRDYEPDAIERDAAVADTLLDLDIGFVPLKDQVIFEQNEILTGGGRPFNVFTPYKNAWLKRLSDTSLISHPVAEYASHFAKPPPERMPSLSELGFEPTDLPTLGIKAGMSGATLAWRAFEPRLAHYDQERDRPDLDSTSRLGVHLRFGTLSIRELARRAYYASGRGAQVWLSELVWRDFFHMILHFFPRVTRHAFRSEYDQIHWPGSEAQFQAWCEGRTGYPIVDAAMRQLRQTGFMHNRLRMVAASFLVKDLLVDWRWGERYFASKLLDYDLASNNGNWQWAASTGCDAQPYFRMFNPVTQSGKFDPEGVFIRRHVPELASLDNRDLHAPWQITPIEQQACGVVLGRDYPLPIVDHASARERSLALFKSARLEEIA